MSRNLIGAVVATAVSVAAGASFAQHRHMHGQDGPAQADVREYVKYPPELVERTLANMREHLVAVHDIQESLSRGETDAAAKIAESRLGMSSLSYHGAVDVAPFMPQGMQDAGTGMHHAASRFAIAATDAGVSGDLKPALAALAEITAQCNACHSGYRIR